MPRDAPRCPETLEMLEMYGDARDHINGGGYERPQWRSARVARERVERRARPRDPETRESRTCLLIFITSIIYFSNKSGAASVSDLLAGEAPPRLGLSPWAWRLNDSFTPRCGRDHAAGPAVAAGVKC